MIDYIIYRCILDYTLILFGLWAISEVITNTLFKRKRRPRLEPSKRQRKLYVHTIPPKGGVVK